MPTLAADSTVAADARSTPHPVLDRRRPLDKHGERRVEPFETTGRHGDGERNGSRRLVQLVVWLLLTSLTGASLADDAPGALKKFQSSQRHMGSDFTVVLYAPDETAANRGFTAAFDRIRRLDETLSDYQETSELSRLSAAAPTSKPVPVGDDLWRTLERARHFHELTDGAFDITVGPYTRLWRRSRRQRELPDAERLQEAREAVGQQHLILHPASQSVELRRPRMRLDPGGIGQGVAADQALEALRALGLRRAIVNASGDIRAGDPPPDAKGWKVGVGPLDPQAPPSRFFELSGRAVSTSGDAFQFVEIGGVRYSHIVDPRTGLGLTRRSSVTVVAPDAVAADALATALCILGPRRGLELAERLPDVEALFVYLEDDVVRTAETTGFPQP